MNNPSINTVDITMGQNVYTTFESLPNTVSHALADFVDNALQSYRDNKARLTEIDPDYKLHVIINIAWNEEDDRATMISISDNAAGINQERYEKAFMPAIKPADNSGLHEFGMGLKTAACWFGNKWSVRTKAIGETEERTIVFDLNEVTKNDLKEIPVTTTAKSPSEHYTKVSITDLTKNAPKLKSLTNIKTELASIYRKSFRENEMILTICGEDITFTDYEILTAPFVKTPDSPPIFWKKDIDFAFGKYKAKGFIAILKTMAKNQNRIVLLRRGRVIVGAETEGHYYSKYISGQSGSPRDKRIFGELELDGFDVAFNKNDIQDKENLEALMEALYSEIHQKDFDLVTQAQDYREDERHKQVKKLIKKHNSSPKDKRATIELFTTNSSGEESPTTPVEYLEPSESSTFVVSDIPTSTTNQPEDFLEFDGDSYKINGKSYTLVVQSVFDRTNHDLFWVDVSKENEGKIICKINCDHIFFDHFGKPSEAVIAILKTMAISKFTAKKEGSNNASDMLNYFNEYIGKTQV